MNATQSRNVVKSAVIGAVLAAVAGSAVADRAEAALMFTLERLSDTEVRLTGTGSVGGSGGPFDTLLLRDVAGSSSGAGGAPGDFKLGSLEPSTLGLNGFLVVSGDGSFVGSYLFANTDTPSGTSTLTRSTGDFVFAAIGATGNIVVIPQDGTSGSEVTAGTWNMVAPVPIPAALPLMVTAVAGLGLAGWRKRNAGRA